MFTIDPVLVTGAAGFLGRHVVASLVASGQKVIGVGRRSNVTDPAWSEQLEHWIEGDICNGALENVDAQISQIYHCAGSGSVALSMRYPERDFASNVLTTREVLEFARNRPNVKVIVASSAAVYGRVERFPIKPSELVAPVSPYGSNKVIAEALCDQYRRHFEVDVRVIRFFSIYGEYLTKQLLWDACQKLTAGETRFFGTGDETRDWIHVTDAARLMIAVAQTAEDQIQTLNGGCGEAVSVGIVVRTLAKLLKVSEDIEFTGEVRPGDPIQYLADISSSLETGWAPSKDFAEGLAEYVNWFNTFSKLELGAEVR